MLQSKYVSDTWSAYKYGDKIKVVYHKVGVNNRGTEQRYKSGKQPNPTPLIGQSRFAASLARSRAAVFELALCNDFTLFVTCTLDALKRDRNDLQAFRKTFTQFIRDQNKKRPDGQKIEYLLIPEQHKNGAWHMHGLFKGLEVGKDIVKNEHGYFDWYEYRKRFGFFSCSKIKNAEACSKYITKYVTKSMTSDKSVTDIDAGCHLYYASQGLKKRETLVRYAADECPVTDWDFENEYVKIGWLSTE